MNRRLRTPRYRYPPKYKDDKATKYLYACAPYYPPEYYRSRYPRSYYCDTNEPRNLEDSRRERYNRRSRHREHEEEYKSTEETSTKKTKEYQYKKAEDIEEQSDRQANKIPRHRKNSKGNTRDNKDMKLESVSERDRDRKETKRNTRDDKDMKLESDRDRDRDRKETKRDLYDDKSKRCSEEKTHNLRSPPRSNIRKRRRYFSYHRPHSMPPALSLGLIPDHILQKYCAAGILPYAVHEQKIFFLLSCEDRSFKTGRNADSKVWMNPGGKREKNEIPAVTAYREFSEETANLFQEQEQSIKNQLNDEKTRKYWFKHGKYVLYLCCVSYQQDIAEKFSAKLSDSNHLQTDHHLAIQWVPYELVVGMIQNGTPFNLDGETVRFFSFFLEMLQSVNNLEGSIKIDT